MSSKAGKITAGKARERIESLEESIASRRHRLDQLHTRLERSDIPDERLVTAKTRLERRIEQEEEQLVKLLRLLDRQDDDAPDESGDFEAEEELEDLHRSFEEIRQNVAHIQARIDGHPEVPRDLETRLSACESRVARREAVDSELFARVMSLQTALDQERQAGRRLTRRFKEQEQKTEDLREAVEDAVVTTVDLAGRIEELAELTAPVEDSVAPTWHSDLEQLQQAATDLQNSLEGLRRQVSESFTQAAQEREAIRNQQEASESAFTQQLAQVELPSFLADAAEATAQSVTELRRQLDSLEAARQGDSQPQETTPLVQDLSVRLESLELALSSKAQSDDSEPFDAIQQRLTALEQLKPEPSLPNSELLSRLDALESTTTPTVDPQLILRLKALESASGSTSPELSGELVARLKNLEFAYESLKTSVASAATSTDGKSPATWEAAPDRKPAVFAPAKEQAGKRAATFGTRTAQAIS